MKYLISCLIVALLISTASAAQFPIEEGSNLISGQLSATNQGGSLYRDFTLIVATPSYQHFVSDGIAIGLNCNVLTYVYPHSNHTSFALGPVASFYLNLDKTRTEVKGAVYPLLRFFASRTTYSAGYGNTTWSYGGMFGVDVMISNAVALQPAVQYQHDVVKFGSYGSVGGHIFAGGIGLEAFVF